MKPAYFCVLGAVVVMVVVALWGIGKPIPDTDAAERGHLLWSPEETGRLAAPVVGAAVAIGVAVYIEIWAFILVLLLLSALAYLGLPHNLWMPASYEDMLMGLLCSVSFAALGSFLIGAKSRVERWKRLGGGLVPKNIGPGLGDASGFIGTAALIAGFVFILRQALLLVMVRLGVMR